MIRLPYGTAESREPILHVHRFQSRDTKTEQRFYAGAGERRLQVSLNNLAPDERQELIDQFAAASGSYLPFNIDLVGPSGTTETLSVRFAVPRLEIQTLIDGSSWASSFDLIVDPGAAPSYTSASTETRFPGSSLQTALLSPVQEIIPLLVITTKAAQVHRVSERACTVDGAGYAAKLVDWDGIKQSLNGADQASFTLANADRAFTTIINSQNWHAADVQFSLLHVGTLIKVNLWRGHVIPGGWDLSGGNLFRITAADGAYELRLAYPPRKITRQDGFVTPADHQPVNLGKGKNRITATSVVHDTGYGKPLRDIWVNDSTAPLKVTCDVIAGRDEREFYAALGIVGRGPIGDFGSLPIIEGGAAVHYGTLDGQPNHGPGLLGLRRSRGGNASTGSETQMDNNPDSGSAILAIDQVGSPLPAQPAPAGAAFLQIRRTDAAGIQPDNATKEHEMIAFVSQGNGGYIWTSGVRSWSPAITNNAWVAVNVWLRGNGVGLAAQSVQETYFNVAAAEALAATCAASVTALVGSGSEEQFRFTGVIQEEKPLRDWLKEILAGCLGYFTFEFGKLKLGSRFHSGSTEAFDSGNILLNSLRLSAPTAEYNNLSATFADREYGYQSNSLEFRETDHIAALGQELKAQINLPGVCTKSQAARLVTSLVREQLGGVNTTEWAAARRISFMTTALALNVECGTICSLTHADMPGGAGEFLVEGWSLNRDMSIAVDGRTTTDAMYDMVVGNKPADVPVNLPPGAVDKLPGLFLYTPVVKDLGFLTLTDCSMTDGSNRGLRSVTVFLVYIDDTEPGNWVTLDASLGTGDPATFNVTPNGSVSFAVDDYVVFEDAGDYEIDRITAIASNTWTLQRNWPGNDPAEAIFESIRVAHAAGTRIYKCKIQKFSFNAAGGTFEDSADTGSLADEFPCQIADARVMAVVASASNGYGYSDWVVYNLGAGLDTDSMSTYAEGITPPGAVTIGSIAYEYIDAYRLRVRIYWTAPDPLGTFVGVHCWEEDPDVSAVPVSLMDGTQAMNGTSNLGGEWAPIDRGRGVSSPFVIEIDAPRSAVTKRFYLSSYSTGAEAALVRATLPSPTPNITLAIAAAAYQSGVEYAQLVTGAVATVEYDDSQVASPKYRIRFQWAVPAIAPAAWQRGFGGVQVVYEYEGGARANGPSLAVNETDAKSDWYDLYVGTSVIRCWFVSYDNSEEPRVNSIISGVTPMSEATVVWPLASRTPAAPYADNVTNFAVGNARYVVNGQGQKVLKIDWSWTVPSGAEALARWGGAIIYLFLPADSNPYQITGAESGSSGTMEFGQFPSSATVWSFYAISSDNNGNPNTSAAAPVSGTPSATITVNGPDLGAAGTEYTSNVTSPSFAVSSLTASDGTTPQRITGSFTKPADVTWGGVEIRVYDGATLIAKSSAAASPVAVTIPNPTTSTTYTSKLVSFDVNGQTNTEVAGTPQGTVIAGSTAGTLDLRKFLPASTDNFTIVGSYVQVKTGVAIQVDGSGNLRVTAGGIVDSLIASGAVTNAKLVDGAVDALKLASAAVTAAKIATDAVTTSAIAASAVTNAKLVDGAVDALKLASAAVTAAKIATDAVTTSAIAASAVTNAKMAVDAVTSSIIASGAVTNAKMAVDAVTSSIIAAGAVTETKVATDAITTPKIVAGAITTAKVAAGAITANEIAANTITAGKIVAGTITGTEIAANTITAAKIFAGTITATELATDSVTSAKIAAGSITAAKIFAGTITATELATDSVTSAKIIAGAITTAKINAGAITATELATDSVTSAKIVAGAITTAKIFAGAITATELATDSVTSAKIVAGAITTVKINAGAVTATEIAALAVVAGKIAANAVTATEIASDAVTAGKILAGSVTTAKVAAGAISSDKLDATQINVGGGGSKPGKFSVFNGSGSQIGFIGVDGSDEGGWLKTLRIGGSSYANGIVRADSSGNVTMDGATFALNLNGTTTTIQNTLDGNLSEYVGVKVAVNSGGGYTTHTALGFTSFATDNTTAVAQLSRAGSPGGGFMQVRDQPTGKSITVTASALRIVLAGTNDTRLQDGYLTINGNQIIGARLSSVSTVSGSATATYTSTEQTMLNDLKSVVNTIISRMQSHGLIS